MPYIKQEERTAYDELIAKILQSDNSFGPQHAKELIDTLKTVDVTNIDGHMNYFITKVLLYIGGFHSQMNVSLFKQFLLTVIRHVYEPRYFNYNRAIGMLTCMKMEYERRNGPRKSFLVKTFIDGLIRTVYETLIAPYEDAKIRENGDVI